MLKAAQEVSTPGIVGFPDGPLQYFFLLLLFYDFLEGDFSRLVPAVG